MALVERLNEIIEQKEDQLSALERKVAQLEEDQSLARLRWQMHECFTEDEFNAQMPFLD